MRVNCRKCDIKCCISCNLRTFLPNRKYRKYRVIIVSKPKISCNIVWTLKKISLRGDLDTKIWKFTTQNLVSGGKITLSNYACLPQFNDMDDAQQGHTAWVYGWGKLVTGGLISNVLMETKGEVITREICQRKWGKWNGRDTVRGYQLCVDYPAGKGDCNGDSGGPVTRAGPDNRHILIGVSSMVEQPCPVKFPSGLQAYFIESIFFRRPKNQISPQMWRTSGSG